MKNKTLGFNRQFVIPIQKENKLGTLRFRSEKQCRFEEGDIVSAIVNRESGAFATIKITNISWLQVRDILDTTFEHHQNYASLDEFNTKMSKYYDRDFTLSDYFVFIEFEVIETFK